MSSITAFERQSRDAGVPSLLSRGTVDIQDFYYYLQERVPSLLSREIPDTQEFYYCNQETREESKSTITAIKTHGRNARAPSLISREAEDIQEFYR